MQSGIVFMSVVAVLFAAILTSQPPVDNSPQTMYAIMSFSYLGAMLCSNHALQYVSYPTQVNHTHTLMWISSGVTIHNSMCHVV